MAERRGPWTVEGSEEKYRNEFIAVREDRVVRPDGRPAAYATVTMKPGVSVLALDDDGRVHLTRQYRYAIRRDSLEAVAGSIDDGEDALAAARRELREELGATARRWTDLGPLEVETSILDAPVRLFLARALSFGPPARDGTEDIRSHVLPLAQAVEAVLSGEIVSAASCALILKVDRLLAVERATGRRPGDAVREPSPAPGV